MTTTHERTRSVVEAGEFLAKLSQDSSLPDPVRCEAKRLLRHYPSVQDISRAGHLESVRQRAIDELSTGGLKLPPSLGTWPLCEPFFSDDNDRPAAVVVYSSKELGDTAPASG
ncbi:BPSL0761 family protein [Pseudomonas bohemica]|uniref:BPSL0761 family protein n=1 Tax=Pseudomonas bohemica TaxID=2044872 RepID=UPI002D7A3DB5|nr:BPSL0761 family protein [Pseudomonas bohemica]